MIADRSGVFRWLCTGIVATATLVTGSTLADTADREQARRIHDRLVGTPVTTASVDSEFQPPTDTLLNEMEALVANGRAREAALLAIDNQDNPGFYHTTVKNWATPWTNEAQSVFAPLNDYSALVIGLVRDQADFRQLLTGSTLYVGTSSSLPAYATNNNAHYEALEKSDTNLSDTSQFQAVPQSSVNGQPNEAIAGIFSTRAAAKAFFVDGTNRAMFRFTLLNHLCMDLEQLKVFDLPADRIRQDVSRSPGGDSRIFLNSCIGCHAGMDPLAQAFAYYEYDYPTEEDAPGATEEARKAQGQLVYTADTVQPKYHINADNFNPGFQTPDDRWSNYWRASANVEKIGWSSSEVTQGKGARSLGAELANTQAFAQCQVKKAFRAVCQRDAAESDRAAMDSMIATFQGGYDMKTVFADIAVHCANEAVE
ncbi:Uncharacterised protein [BD1-7 clade bacterium]|uniref:DUF1585 domain-containing protein n=1 Tax=BD1-7 clade bacterium TaxID=2029982 RepID=A0A5S9P6T6_9GAMM|nr:Uncharacterised protein [BD1-7 clade bacterium]